MRSLIRMIIFCKITGRPRKCVKVQDILKKYSYLFWGLIPVTVETKIDQDPSCLLGGSEKQKLCFFKKFVWQKCAPLTAKLK